MAGKTVVDTSVLIKWIKTKDEELLAEARRLLRQVESKPLSVHVPALLLYEIGKILLLKTNLDPDELEKAIDELEALPFIVAPPATPLLQRAARVGREFILTFYDASFLALAVELWRAIPLAELGSSRKPEWAVVAKRLCEALLARRLCV